MGSLLLPPFITGRGAVGLLLVRLAVGAAFVLHGWPKIQNPTAWMGDALPGYLQAVAAAAEVGGGIALALGLLTPLAALTLAGVMVGALATVHLPQGHPFVAPGKPSSELAVIYLAVTLLVLLIGPGVLSVDGLLFNRPRPAGAGPVG